MKIAVIGSCVGGDIVVKAKEKGWSLGENFVSFSPCAIINGADNNIILPDEVFENETIAERKRIKVDFEGGILNRVIESQSDYVLVDFSDFRIAEKIYEFENGRKISVTQRNINESTIRKIEHEIEQQLSSKIKKIKVINYNERTEEEKRKYIKQYYDLLNEKIGKDKVIYFSIKLANQYIDGNEIKHTPNFRITGNTNKTICQIYDIFKEFDYFLEAPTNIIGDISCLNPFEYHFSKPYYDYMIDCIEWFIACKNADLDYFKEKKEICEEKLHTLYNTVFCNQILNKIASKLDRKIVLVGKTKLFAHMLKERYDKEIYEYIEYNEKSNLEEISLRISKLRQVDKNIIYIVPELFRHQKTDGLSKVFHSNKCLLEIDCILPDYKRIVLDKFNGVYEDIYNNYFEVNSLTTITYGGAAISFKIGKNSIGSRNHVIFSDANCEIGDNLRVYGMMLLHIYHGAQVIMKNNITIVKANIAVHAFSSIHIGEDVMMSNDEMIYNGDGHAIFEMQEDGKYKHVNECTNDKIIIGDHVWIGYGCKILNGARIGDGSIIGAGSLVNKKFPNNVVIVGSPAKVVRKNIAWTRNVLIQELERDEYVYKNYANKTVEE